MISYRVAFTSDLHDGDRVVFINAEPKSNDLAERAAHVETVVRGMFPHAIDVQVMEVQ